jgi:hypothetical protein
MITYFFSHSARYLTALFDNNLLDLKIRSVVISDFIARLLSLNVTYYLPFILSRLPMSSLPTDAVPNLLLSTDVDILIRGVLPTLKQHNHDFSAPVSLKEFNSDAQPFSVLSCVAGLDAKSLAEHGFRLCSLLISYGAPVAPLNAEGDTILHLLVRLGAIPDYYDEGSTPKQKKEFEEVVTLCRQRGVNFNAPENKEGSTVLKVLLQIWPARLKRMATMDGGPLTDDEKTEAKAMFL